MDYAKDHSEPWYRNPWVWLVIAIPSLTILGCAVTVYLALSNPDMVIDEYGAILHIGSGIPAITGLG